jgi:hypothetical protein
MQGVELLHQQQFDWQYDRAKAELSHSFFKICVFDNEQK